MADVSLGRTRRDERAVSTTLGYVLNVGVATVLVVMLLFSAGTLVENQREQAVRTELTVVGERVAADLAAGDRLARASDGGDVRLTVSLPARVAGATYEVRVNETGSDHVVLVADRPDVTVSVPYATVTPVDASNVSGGRLVVSGGDGRLEVAHA